MAENKKSSIGGKSTCHLLNVKNPERASSRIKFSFKRTSATINVLKSGRSMEASMGFIDISETGAGFFTAELLLKGSTVEVCVMEPSVIKIKALVAWSIPIKSGIKSGRFAFRSGLQFIFDNEIQRTSLKEFINKVNSDPLEYAKGGNVPEPSVPVSNADIVSPVSPVAADGITIVTPEGVAAPSPSLETPPVVNSEVSSVATDPAPVVEAAAIISESTLPEATPVEAPPVAAVNEAPAEATNATAATGEDSEPKAA